MSSIDEIFRPKPNSIEERISRAVTRPLAAGGRAWLRFRQQKRALAAEELLERETAHLDARLFDDIGLPHVLEKRRAAPKDHWARPVVLPG